MLTGRFGNTTGAPYIEGRLHIPRFGLSTNVSFLIDTGADQTVLSVDDAIRSGIDFATLTGNKSIGGIGGWVGMFEEPALAIFRGTSNLYLFELQILIPPATPDMSRIPSLLGRDILKRVRMTSDPTNRVLTLEVLAADSVVPIPAP